MVGRLVWDFIHKTVALLQLQLPFSGVGFEGAYSIRNRKDSSTMHKLIFLKIQSVLDTFFHWSNLQKSIKYLTSKTMKSINIGSFLRLRPLLHILVFGLSRGLPILCYFYQCLNNTDIIYSKMQHILPKMWYQVLLLIFYTCPIARASCVRYWL